MKIKINRPQLQLLTNNFMLVEGHGLSCDEVCLITEGMKEFKVKVYFNGWPTEIRVGAHSSSSALAIARLMFPKATIIGSTRLA